MRFRPCIDIHNGKVKQIVGGSLKDHGDKAVENFVSGYDAAFYAELYKKDNLKGGHVILLNPVSSEYYEKNRQQALAALKVFPGGLQVGGGVTAENAAEFIEAGASHVIVTSYVFREGQIQWDNLERLVRAVGKEHIVLDLSCRKKDASYYIVTDRWQTFTKIQVNEEILYWLKESCSEFLVHGVDSEGKAAGVPEDLVTLLSKIRGIPITYAGGIGSLKDLEQFRQISGGNLDFTIGSALDLFGGTIPYDAVKNMS
ncbi:phosphoribosylformimino-5-aminoimidazole carboxamide ribotide isomerase [Claveliimonas bilis]|uniref:phosphoribosylformimino-5-aminoimidazole carboxamide ribotide isomerase n=1 Tax=Clostridia TaxID=186801 RepID=UPI00210DFDD9|nr:phosphoribosylformimino-5-aminoimidazole carboxamide ribotide isomerase [Claveliimonas bilis]MCQ5202974.1 phosphoribosylformimino-5-aminoimidazole carboxamide ribotide isomerase [Mordavella massiliensis]BDZ83019.1 1-(5-phosphoribosyl)-5-[(5-phosphoribosylamino) methylideneamino] imidazole-4-carboxamide isomerase [Claveliimonas bilis]